MAPSKTTTTSLSAAVHTDQDGTVIIDAVGDVVLIVQREVDNQAVSFRTTSSKLKAASPYFRILLDPHKFSEGIGVAKELGSLGRRYANLADVPSSELPHVHISDVGAISSVKSIRPLMTDFFQMLHEAETCPRKPPLSNLANLAVVAERFDTVAAFKRWVNRGYAVGRGDMRTYNEEQSRQRLLVGLVLDHEPWVKTASYNLIMNGSSRWTNQPIGEPAALWWDLPRGVEEELQYRRECILQTISSLQSHLLAEFTSRTRQCRLGYDSSPQCDSFQLGEFVKFLTRLNLLSLRPLHLAETEADAQPGGDIKTLIGTLRQCPSYQVDHHHSHCGPRKRLMMGLDKIESYLAESNIGICFWCWQISPRTMWLGAKGPARVVEVVGGVGGRRGAACGGGGMLHHEAMEWFVAEDRIWGCAWEH